MMQKFIEAGYEIVYFEDKADVYIINTCTVTNMADKKARQMIRRVKEINPEAILVAVGCYAQVAKEELEKIPEIDLILGTNEKKNIYNLVNELVQDRNLIGKEEKNQKIDITDVLHCEEYAEFGEVTFTEKTRAVIKVQDGCDNFCSYCIIPYVRGSIRSKDFDTAIEEVKTLVLNGHKEVVLTGIHTGSYSSNGHDLSDLIEEMAKIPAL